MESLAYELDLFVASTRTNMPIMLGSMGVLWAINIFNWLIGSRLNILGIFPRHLLGLPGIIFAPILHSNFNHLFFNSIPLFALGLFVMSDGIIIFIYTTILITLMAGGALWLVGRHGIHLGASGVISGYFGFVLTKAYERPTLTSLFLGIIALYYFGSILLSIIPTSEKLSWEGHLLGILSGIGSVYLLNYLL